MREAFRGLKLREKKVYLCLLTTPKDLLNSIFITESFCGVQKKRTNLEKNLCSKQNPMVERHRNQNCRMSELEGTFKTSKSHHLFSFPDGKSQVQRGKETDTMPHSNSVLELGQNPLPLIPVFGLPTHHIRGQHSSPLGQGRAGQG